MVPTGVAAPRLRTARTVPFQATVAAAPRTAPAPAALLEASRTVVLSALGADSPQAVLELVAAHARVATGATRAGVLDATERRWLVEPHGRTPLRAEAVAPLAEEGRALLQPLRGAVGPIGALVLLFDAPRGDLATLGRDLARFCADAAAAAEHVAARAAERAALERARDAERDAHDLLSAAAHELRSPLTAAGGFLELVLRGSAGEVPAGQRRHLEVVERNTRRLQGVVADLLTLAGVQRATRPVREAVAVAPWLERAASDASIEAGEGGVTIDVTATAGDLAVVGAPDQLDQVLANLLVNACKFSAVGTTVRLGAVRTPDGVKVTVADEGIGIAPDELRRVFDRFYRANTAHDARVPGTGLGLAIVREIVVAHGGRVWCESAVGRGSAFHVLLPAAA